MCHLSLEGLAAKDNSRENIIDAFDQVYQCFIVYMMSKSMPLVSYMRINWIKIVSETCALLKMKIVKYSTGQRYMSSSHGS